MSDEHDWTFDSFHQAHRCRACGLVSYAAELPPGPCTCAPSRWVPPGASEPEPAAKPCECWEDDCHEPGAVMIGGLLHCTEHAAVEFCRWPGPCPAGQCRDCDAADELERADDDPADLIEAMLERAGERYRASLAEPLDAEAEAELQRLRVRLGLVEDGALCAVLPQCEVSGCEGTAVASYGGTLVCEEHDPAIRTDTATLRLPGLEGGGE